jgi:hypothetical protein
MLVYDDRPHYDWGLKVLLSLPVVVLLTVALVFNPQGRDSVALPLIATLVFLMVVLRCVLPRRYVVMDDRLRIDLGWPLGFNLSYRNLSEVRRDSGGWRVTANWVTTFRPSRALRIVPVKGIDIIITPNRRDQFADQLEKALASWRRRPTVL